MTIESTDVPAEPLSFERFAALAHWRIELELTRAGLTPGAALRDDAWQEALLALWRTFRRIGPDRAAKLAGRYIHQTVRHGIANAFRAASHLPRGRRADVALYRELTSELGEEGAREELARRGWKAVRISRTLQASALSFCSLEERAELLGDAGALPDPAPNPAALLQAKERRLAGEQALAGLPPPLRRAVEGRADGLDYGEIAAREPRLISKQAAHLRTQKGLRLLHNRLRIANNRT